MKESTRLKNDKWLKERLAECARIDALKMKFSVISKIHPNDKCKYASFEKAYPLNYIGGQGEMLWKCTLEYLYSN